MSKRINFKSLIFISSFLSIICFSYLYISHLCLKSSKTNIILIMGDSLRADHLGCYGYNKNTSPCIDKFSEKLTLYENCFSAATWTVPSNYSLLTSLYPPQHKVINWGMKFNANTPNLVSFLHNQGYSIGVFGSNTLFLQTLKEQFPGSLNGYEETNDATSTTSAALKWIKTQKGGHFFAWVYYLNPHRPYSPPAPHNTLFVHKANNKLEVKKATREPLGGWDSIPSLIVKNGIDDPDYYKAQYDGEIHYLDEEVGKLLEGLSKMGLFRNSLIIFTSDHGESLGEHHLYFNHTFTVFDEIIKVPLLVKFPFQKKGRKVKENVSLIDIFPTILHQLGFDVFKQLEGKSLACAIDPLRELFSCNETRNISALICDKWKLIQYPFEPSPDTDYIKLFFSEYPSSKLQLFNIHDDPYEKTDLRRIEKQRYADMESKLRDFEYRIRHIYYNSAGKFELKEQSMKKLKSLGYTQ